ncbi:MAG: glycine oxidase ThiO [bacterium]|nr:glycine oxidase ThiO [bacterium]
MSNRTISADCVVVGGGIIGLSVAYELLRRGRGVHLFERDRAACGSTAAAGGMLAPVCEAESEPEPLVRLGTSSLELYPAWIADIERDAGGRCGYRADGTLWVASDRDAHEELGRLESILADKRLPIRRLDRASLREREPHLSPRALGGLLVESDHQVDPRALAAALARGIARRGGTLHELAAVRALTTAGDRVSGVEVEGPCDGVTHVAAREVVLASGAWAAGAIEGVPLPALGVRPVKGQLLRLCGEPLLSHVVRTPDVYLIPRADGELLLGATVEELGFDDSATAGPMMDLLRDAWEVLPGVYDLRFVDVSVGLRPATRDQLPLIGPTAVEGLHLALGHYRNGILLAPATASAVADGVANGATREEHAAFSPRRLRDTTGKVRC